MGKNRLLQKRIMACVMAATMVVPSNVMASPYQTDEENPTAWEAAADDAEAVPEAEEAPVEDVVSEETVDAEAVEVQAADEENALSIANVVSIQATTKPNFYGQRLYQITIQFSQNTDMTDADKAESYGVWDRSYKRAAQTLRTSWWMTTQLRLRSPKSPRTISLSACCARRPGTMRRKTAVTSTTP